MSSELILQTVNTIPCDGQVRDYDQLETETKQYIVELAEAETPLTVPSEIVESIISTKIIKYTSYIRIREHKPS